MLAKIVNANVMSMKDLGALFRVQGFNSSATEFHGRTLLSLQWVRPGVAEGSLPAQLMKRTLRDLSDRWWRSLASDLHLRFCPSCLALGFQSALCQIDGLSRCPAHGDAIVSRCDHCGAPTPRYAVTPMSFERPLHCSSCARPYAPIWSLECPVVMWRAPKHLEAYEELEVWLRRASAMDIEWPDQSMWMANPSQDENTARDRRMCMFSALQGLCDGCPTQMPPRTRIWRFKSLNQERTIEWCEEHTSCRRQIYKSMRRHYRRVLGVRTSELRRVSDELIWERSRYRIVLPATARVSACVPVLAKPI
jgi:hypothetical protein